MKRFKSENGAVIVEASLIIPMIMMLVITLMWVVNLCTAQAKIQIAVNSAAKEVSQFSYLYGLTGLNDKRSGLAQEGQGTTATVDEGIDGIQQMYSGLSSIGDTGKQAFSSGNFSNVVSDARNGYDNVEAGANTVKNVYDEIKKDPKSFLIGLGKASASVGIDVATSYLIAAPLGKYFAEKHLSTSTRSADQYLKKLGVVGGFDGINFNLSRFCTSGNDEIMIVAQYKLAPIRFFNIDVEYNIVQTGATKAWFGVSKIDKSSENGS